MVAQQYGPQVRSDVISDAVQTSFNDAVREQNLRVAGYPRIEPAPSTTRPTRRARVLRGVRGLSRDHDRRRRAARRSSGRRSRSPTPTSTARSTCCASSARRSTRRDDGAQSGDRVMVDFTGTIDGVEFPGGQAQGLRDHARRGPHAARVRGRGRRHEGRRDEDVPADVPGRLPRQGSRREERAVHADGEERQRADVPPLDSAFATAFGIKSGKRRGPARRGRVEPASSSSSARSSRCSRTRR